MMIAHFCSAVLWPRPSQEVEKYREKGCPCGISGFPGHGKYRDLSEKHVYVFVWIPISLPLS